MQGVFVTECPDNYRFFLFEELRERFAATRFFVLREREDFFCTDALFAI
jgi:hypothetical protein